MLLAGLRILVVDDDPGLVDVLCDALREDGATVEGSPQATEAVPLASSFQPDLLVTDLVMPGMDGFDLLRTLRERGFAGPAIAITSFAQLRERAVKAGFAACLTKPFPLRELASCIRSSLKQP